MMLQVYLTKSCPNHLKDGGGGVHVLRLTQQLSCGDGNSILKSRPKDRLFFWSNSHPMVNKASGHYSPFLHYQLVPCFKKSILETQVTRTPLTSKVRGVLVTCFSNIDFSSAGNQPIMQKW